MTATPPAIPLIDSFVGPAGASVVLMNDGTQYVGETAYAPVYDGHGHAVTAVGTGQYLSFSISGDDDSIVIEFDVALPGTNGIPAEPLPDGYPANYYSYYTNIYFTMGTVYINLETGLNSLEGIQSGGGNNPAIDVPAHSFYAQAQLYDENGTYYPASRFASNINLLTTDLRLRFSYSYTTHELVAQVLSRQDRSVLGTCTFTQAVTKNHVDDFRFYNSVYVSVFADKQHAYMGNLASTGVLTGFQTKFPYNDATDLKPMGKNWEDEGANTWTVDTGYGATGTGDVTAGLRSPVSLFSVRLATLDTRAGIEAADGSQLLVSSSALIKKFAGGEQPYGFSADARVALITDPSPADLIQMSITGDEITVTVGSTVVLQTSVPGFNECRRVVLDG